MNSLSRQSLKLAICLSALAGYVDALGFLHLAGYFVSFMSGNSTRLVVAIAEGQFDAALLLLKIIGFFVFGAGLGAVISNTKAKNSRLWVLSGVSILLLFGAASYELGHSGLTIAFIVTAMGAENAVFQKDGTVSIGLTYMTGTLVKIGQKVAAALMGKEPYGWVPYLLLWCGLVSGGLIGALSYASFNLHGLWAAVAWAFGLTIAVWYSGRATSS